ncbi:MAG: hypothetical protein D6796_17440 [Caldilineae bacterium]|nr:MAG: hypothetical protein D6796_17440 [Caldilineae bacterium]
MEDKRSLLTDELDENTLRTEVAQALRRTIFDSTLRISPRRVNQIAAEFVTAFYRFIEHGQEDASYQYGQTLAQAGMGPSSILTMLHTLTETCQASENPGRKLLPLVNRYMHTLLLGYMEGREAYIRQEQERTMRAFKRTQNQKE